MAAAHPGPRTRQATVGARGTIAAPAIGRHIRANLSTAELYEDAIRAGEGLVAAEGPLVVRTGRHTGRSPEDKFIVARAVERGEDLVGRGQPADLRGALRAPPGPPAGLRADRARSTPRTASSGPTRAIAARSGSTPRRPGRASSPGTCSAGRRADRAGRASRPNFTIIDVPSFKADPATEGTRTETAILRPPARGWRSSSSAPSTPARSRRAPSRS